MKHSFKGLVGFLVPVLAGVLSVGVSAQQIPQGPVTGNADRGAALFYKHTCYGCHGFNGQTGRQDLVGTNSGILINEDTFTAFLRGRQNVAPLLPSTSMPNYPANALSDAEAKDVYAYIRSMRVDAPETGGIPAFQAILESAQRPYQP
ncbi:MAG: cytochrome c [Pseudomonadales bacterium]|nr:cytochrome c [Pseudomonadales bacterium]